jgi:hypothetical protein
MSLAMQKSASSVPLSSSDAFSWELSSKLSSFLLIFSSSMVVKLSSSLCGGGGRKRIFWQSVISWVLPVRVGGGNGTFTVFMQVLAISTSGNKFCMWQQILRVASQWLASGIFRQWQATAHVHIGICGFCTEWHQYDRRLPLEKDVQSPRLPVGCHSVGLYTKNKQELRLGLESMPKIIDLSPLHVKMFIPTITLVITLSQFFCI